jgi:hypothetical protein
MDPFHHMAGVKIDFLDHDVVWLFLTVFFFRKIDNLISNQFKIDSAKSSTPHVINTYHIHIAALVDQEYVFRA